MSVSYIPESTKCRLWAKAGGRCQYEGCNEPLWKDAQLTSFEFNHSYIAHIIADKKTGPRGDKILSPKLKSAISNLMLMCDKHHRLIDKIDEAGHPASRLQAMKKAHEERIEILTDIQDDKKSHILLYGANVGDHAPDLSYQKASQAMAPTYYPVGGRAIELGMKNSAAKDYDAIFWQIENANLEAKFAAYIRPQIEVTGINHFSVFGFAPIPLLARLGSLLTDIPAATIYQLHREPPDWKWQEDSDNKYILDRPDTITGIPAVVLSLSATIDNSRVTSVFSQEHSIWRLTVAEPGNDYLKGPNQLREFREIFRGMLDEIKAKHGQGVPIHVFTAVPVSVAIEIGRVRQPKADSPLVFYDQNNNSGGFLPALTID